MKTLRWGIVGTGDIAHSMAGIIRMADAAEIGAVSSRCMASAQEFAQAHGVANAFDSWQEMIESDAIDAVLGNEEKRALPDYLPAILAGDAVVDVGTYGRGAPIADEWIGIQPGTDAALMLAMANVLFAEGLVRLGRLEGRVEGLEEVERLARRR